MTKGAVFWVAAGCMLAACSSQFDADVPSVGRGFDTSADAAGGGQRPTADGRGVISYPGYQVALARRGDTPADIAARLGVGAEALASYNGIAVNASLRDGELLVLPGGSGPGGGAQGGPVDIASVAGSAIARAEPTAARIPAGGVQTTALPSAPSGPAAASMGPGRHRVQPGETAFSIARRYEVTPEALAALNGLGQDYGLRVGQILLIPTTPAAAAPVRSAAVSRPGEGSATPVPPSAATPLPQSDATPQRTEAPRAPAMADSRTSASQLAMPASGAIIRAYAKGKNEGIDIGAGAGSPVKAAEAGTVAAITRDVDQVPIIVVRHKDNLLTVYAGVDGVRVAKGDTVTRGQEIAKVRAGSPAFLHFEVRKGFESVDPMPYLN